MYSFENEYLELLQYILDKGEQRTDRTGTGTRSIFGANILVDLKQGFPMLTTKKLPFKSIVSELLWFIEGSGDERRLAELLHGTRSADKTTIWTANARQTSGSAFQPEYPGDLGRIYGVQWRSWKNMRVVQYEDFLHHHPSGATYFGAKVKEDSVDQLALVIDKLKNAPHDRRIVMTAWNPGELDQMALPPCHMFVQFYLSNDRTLHAQMYQRSADVGIGTPFNIASYALLTHMVAHVIGATPGMLTIVMGDTHIYNNHFDAINQQLQRTPRVLPSLRINRQVQDINDFKMEDFELVGYDPYPAIKMDMAS
jgi:thymidylate synthase